MAPKKDTEMDTSIQKQYGTLKRKHPDALLMFREGDFYRLYREDAVKAAAVLAITLADRMLPGTGEKVKTAEFPFHALDAYLPRLIREGCRVAICDRLDDPRKVERSGKKNISEQTNPNEKDMPRKKKEQAVQEEPAMTAGTAAMEKPENAVKNAAGEKPDNEQKAETAQEQKRREPQMITADGGKVSHGHAYQSKNNPEDWYFTARIDGQQLKPQLMDAADLAAYQKREIGVPQLMERYYPTKLMPKVSEDAYRMPKAIAGPEGAVTIDKFNVYKEKDEQRPDYGKYKFFVQMGDTRMSTVASTQDLNAYFDRVVTAKQLVEKNFGERLHLQSAYEKYRLPEGVDPSGVRVAKDHADSKWKVSVDLGERGQTSKRELSFDDGYSLFRTQTATREQIAAKYLNAEVSSLLAANTVKMEKSASMKM